MSSSFPFSPPRLRVLSSALGAIALALSSLHGQETAVVQNTKRATHEKTGVDIVMGAVELPRKGRWMIGKAYEEQGGLIEIYLDDSPEAVGNPEGKRMAGLVKRRAMRDRMRPSMAIYWRCANLAREGDGLAPEKLPDVKHSNPREHAEKAGAAKSHGIHMIPGVRLYRRVDGRMVRVEKGEPFLIDTTPVIDDGKHWCIDSRGAGTRKEIDTKLMESLGLTVTPQRSRESELGPTVKRLIYARLKEEAGPAKLTAEDLISGKTIELQWDVLSSPEVGDKAICREWAALRLKSGLSMIRRDAPLGLQWAERTVAQYQLGDEFRGFLPGESAAFRGRTTGAMGVLGGRAAIQETLQMRNIRAKAEKPEAWNPTIPIEKIPGVEVESHPFEEMLAGSPGGRLPLADWIPQDHFLAYFPKPDGLFSMLEGGSKFVFASGATFTGRSAVYKLKQRYLDDLGLSENLLKTFLKTGAIKEMAVTTPDLFIIDGTEMSAVMRLGNSLLTNAALRLVGIPAQDGTTVKKNKRGGEVHWVRRGEILIVSTSKKEVDAILAAKEQKRGLGVSAELRYMLTQVPLSKDTAIFLYFADPFIRNLVGPKTKIGQLRRLLARAEMEELSAGSLLASFDGHGKNALDRAFLEKHEYVRHSTYAPDLGLDENAVSSSPTHGSASHMNTLSSNPADLATIEERDSYKQYLDDYNRYWRRYYDPIAIRYDQLPDGVHQVETFILPLIDNSVYNSLREILPEEAEDVFLEVPIMEPTPIAMMSFNMNEDAWLEALDEFDGEFEEIFGLDGSMLDLLGPDVHFAIQDADPIISIGNGELSKLFGEFGGRGGGGEMLGIGAAISVLTRPCTLNIGLSDPELMRKKLAAMTRARTAAPAFGGMGSGSLYQITGEEKWVYRLSVENVITLRIGIEVQDRYLVINNLPFSNPVKVTGKKTAPNGAAFMELQPAACLKQLPALFSSAVEQRRVNSTSGAACLQPFLMSGLAGNVLEAQERHRALFGFMPIHPGGGTWTWDAKRGALISSLYGPPWLQQQPGFDPENTSVGLLRNIHHVNLGMQFEDDGLRSTVRWKLR